ncbi:hypothetical protein J7J90_02795 [Candidatus Micrarchaeota archaeon]|nr:hypothetical protein [Candidatus Micrarchaeota archaeon]
MKGFIMALSILLLCMIFISIICIETPKVTVEQNIVKEKPLNTTDLVNSSNATNLSNISENYEVGK